MNNLKAGFGRTNINPPMGISIRGYYKPRYAEAILDDLEVNAIALQCGADKVILISVDHCGIEQKLSTEFRKAVSEVTGVPEGCIYLSATHTHTGPQMTFSTEDELVKEYTSFVKRRIVDASKFAVDDLQDAKMGYGQGKAPNVAFIRRYVMKDGSVMTNPGVNNPDIVRPVGETDESVSVLRFDRKDAESIVFVNFANHPDTVGGNKISADWPGLLRKNVEKILDGTKCIFFNGAQGDVNHVNVHPKQGDLNNMFIDFDDVARGYSHAEYVARVVTGGVLQAFDKVNYIDINELISAYKIIDVPSNRPDPKDLPEAHRLNNLHNEGKDNEIPYEGMMLTTIVAEAARMVRLENGPDAFDMRLSALAIGPVAIIGIPGEPFAGVGKGLKETSDFDMVIPCCLMNGCEGYFPMQDSYDEGGYEARGSKFKAGVAEFIISEGKNLLASLNK